KTFEEGRLTLSPASVIKRLKRKDDGNVTVTLQRVFDHAWRPMSSYVHGGISQVARRNAPKYIGTNYSPEEIADMLTLANGMAVLAVMGIPDLTNDASFVNEVNRIVKNYVDGA